MEKVKTEEKRVFDEDKYFVNEKTGKLFCLKEGSRLNGDLERFIELSEEQFEEYSSYRKEKRFNNKKTKSKEMVEYDSSFEKEEKIRSLAMVYDDSTMPKMDDANKIFLPISEKIKENFDTFLSETEERKGLVSENVATLAGKLQKEAKKIVPKKLVAKMENSKHLAKLFSLKEKRNKKLNISKKSIMDIKGLLQEEKMTTAHGIKTLTKKIEEYADTIIQLGHGVEEISKYLEDRLMFLEGIPDGEKTFEQEKFIQSFQEETEEMATTLVEMKAMITSTAQRRTINEENRIAATIVLKQLDKVDNFVLTQIFQEYEIYMMQRDLSNSNDVIKVTNKSLNNIMEENTSSMKKSLLESHKLKGQLNVQVETLAKRQSAMIELAESIEKVAEESRAKIIKDNEDLAFINQTAIYTRKNIQTQSTESHINHVRRLLNGNQEQE